MSDETENELILGQKEEIVRLVRIICHLGPEDIRVEQLANQIYSNF